LMQALLWILKTYNLKCIKLLNVTKCLLIPFNERLKAWFGFFQIINV
jgi:hypothetical protein